METLPKCPIPLLPPPLEGWHIRESSEKHGDWRNVLFHYTPNGMAYQGRFRNGDSGKISCSAPSPANGTAHEERFSIDWGINLLSGCAKLVTIRELSGYKANLFVEWFECLKIVTRRAHLDLTFSDPQ